MTPDRPEDRALSGVGCGSQLGCEPVQPARRPCEPVVLDADHRVTGRELAGEDAPANASADLVESRHPAAAIRASARFAQGGRTAPASAARSWDRP